MNTELEWLEVPEKIRVLWDKVNTDERRYFLVAFGIGGDIYLEIIDRFHSVEEFMDEEKELRIHAGYMYNRFLSILNKKADSQKLGYNQQKPYKQ